MGLFPTDANDGDEVTNTNGTTFKYVAADDKWIIVNDLTISDLVYDEGDWDANPDAATKNVLRDKIELLVALIAANTTVAEAVQAVEDAGIVLSASKVIEFDGTPADGTYTGLVLSIDTTGCATFDAVYCDGANSVAKAQATGIATMPAIGVVVAVGKVLTHGVIRSDGSWAFSAGDVIYINETVAGELDNEIPALATELVQVMGVAIGTDIIHVNPSLDWVVRK